MVRWLEARDLADLNEALPVAAPLALVADLRDPDILSLLHPSPTASDYADERRPGASDRRYFLARRAATRSLAALFAGCTAQEIVIGYDAPGAPHVASGICHVSVSGRGPLAAIAVAHQPVGVDIEILHEGVDVVADVLHPDEQAMIASLNGNEVKRHFLRIWTAKEAFLKALGAGLNIDPAQVAVMPNGESGAAIRYATQSNRARASFYETTFDRQHIIVACVTFETRN